jgi:hypothetical protein
MLWGRQVEHLIEREIAISKRAMAGEQLRKAEHQHMVCVCVCVCVYVSE